ncbi:MAG TPA: LuxR C-terminal-related transcriptional regulator [Anaerolineales bacterium]|nr:LuxR C-terminal-related transcriptional regulator [Anaerolineales bacterium]
MAAPVLATKLFVPPLRRDLVMRQRLIDQLNTGVQQKLILISAPAGFGKTTLVSEWAANCGRPVAWLSLDEGDNDPTRFITYLIAALQMIAANIGAGALGMLHASQPQPPQIESLLTVLINEITTISATFIIILDDYHVIESKAVDNLLIFLIEHLPPQMHLVIATREDPNLSLARLRARGQLTELRAVDMRFTPAETADFLNRMMGLNLSDTDITKLESRTEGWIAGLQLAALSMQGQSDPAKFIESFTGSHHFILDYLVEEVLGRQPREIQNFLLYTAILDRLCGPLCEAVLETPPGSGQSTLEELERANLFLIPLDNERRWYRYHHLFGELLRQRLGQPQEFSNYHLRASVWYEANDDLAKAFRHAHAAGDFERAARLAEVAWQVMERNFQTAVWLGWVKKLPDAVLRSRPRLCLQLGSAYSDAGNPDASETHLQNAERALAGVMDQAEAKSLRANIVLIRASNAQNQGDLAETVKYAELSLQLIPEDDLYLRAQAVITLELTHWTTGNLEASLRAMYAWTDDMHRSGNQVFVIASAFAMADMQVILGHLGEAEKILRQAIQQAAALDREAETITAHHHLGLALLAYERGDEMATAQHLHTATDLGKHTTLVDWNYRWNMAQARLKESAGDWDAALQFFDEASRVYVKTAIPMLQPVKAHEARVYLKRGLLEKAQAWARERNISTEDDVRYLDEYEHLTLARVRLAEGSFTGVNNLLERLLALAETQKRIGSVIEILLTQALVHQAQNHRPQAFAALERALMLTELEHYLRIFVDEGEAMQLLISDFRSTIAPSAHPLLGYVDRILDFFPQPVEDTLQSKIENPKHLPRAQVPGSAGECRGVQVSKMIEPLTDRELEVLRLIAEGHSNTEISQRLYLALSTVKGHNLRIFNKLQAQNRTEAVARARELGLL